MRLPTVALIANLSSVLISGAKQRILTRLAR
jgi:hypothetical protein